MKTTISFLTLALVFGSLPVAAQTKATPSPHAHHAEADAASKLDVPVAAQAPVAVVDAFSRSLAGKDFKGVETALDPAVIILESGGAERSREEYLGHHAIADAMFLADAHVALMRRTARVDGDNAWVASESEVHVSKDGKPTTLLSTETMVLKNTPTGWKIVHIHWSSRPKKDDKPAAKAPSPDPQPSTTAIGKAPAWMQADDRAVLENAQGAGMAKAAETHGWPGPKHVLDLADDLQLDAMQRERMRELMATMQASARDLGRQVIAAEAALDMELAKTAPAAARIAALSEQVGALRGRLRSVHLETHLQAAEVLTPTQRHRYMQLRGGAHHGAAS